MQKLTTQNKKRTIKNLNKKNGKLQLILPNFPDIKSNFLYHKIGSHIKGRSILDIGTGSGNFAAYLYFKGYSIETVDVKDKSPFQEYPHQIYDGLNLPYQDNQFETALLIYVLHHCQDKKRVLEEALRVSRRVIFIEDTYRNRLEWLWIALKDSIGNREYYLHKYNTPAEWRDILRKKKCNILFEDSYSRFEYYVFYGRYVMFVVEKEPNNN